MQLHRAVKPHPSDEISFSLPEIEKFKLKNGLSVFFVKRSHLPILRVNLILDTGSKYDPEGKKGFVNLFSMMIDEGAGLYNALELNEEFDILGSNFDISSNNDNIFLSLRTLKENLDRSLELFASIVTNPHFKEEDFAREQRKILTRILQLNDDPDEIANIIFEYNLFGISNPYAYPVIGYEKDIKSMANSGLKDFYKNYFCPSNAAIIVVGDTTKEEIEGKLNHYLKDWQETNNGSPLIHNSVSKEKRIFLVHKEESVQSEIRIGHLSSKRSSPGFFSKTILNTILGGQFSSRINLNLREDKGYTYGAFSRFNYYKDAAYFYVSTSVGAENTGNAVKEIFNELVEVRKGISFEELAFAQSSIIRKFPSNFETNQQIASNISSLIIHSLEEDYFDNYINNVRHVTIDDVEEAAVNNIFPDDAVVVVVGDKNKLSGQLKDFNREIVEVELPVI